MYVPAARAAAIAVMMTATTNTRLATSIVGDVTAAHDNIEVLTRLRCGISATLRKFRRPAIKINSDQTSSQKERTAPFRGRWWLPGRSSYLCELRCVLLGQVLVRLATVSFP
jgi:hypothetical protein